MTQKDKELLLKDLCARLLYKVKIMRCVERNNKINELISELNLSIRLVELFIGNDEFIIKPYLRPMSSMTEEEKQMMDSLWKDNNRLVFADPDEVRRYKFYDISVVDFLNSRHFDYRGLIKKGLALEAPKGMYN